MSLIRFLAALGLLCLLAALAWEGQQWLEEQAYLAPPANNLREYRYGTDGQQARIYQPHQDEAVQPMLPLSDKRLLALPPSTAKGDSLLLQAEVKRVYRKNRPHAALTLSWEGMASGQVWVDTPQLLPQQVRAEWVFLQVGDARVQPDGSLLALTTCWANQTQHSDTLHATLVVDLQRSKVLMQTPLHARAAQLAWLQAGQSLLCGHGLWLPGSSHWQLQWDQEVFVACNALNDSLFYVLQDAAQQRIGYENLLLLDAQGKVLDAVYYDGYLAGAPNVAQATDPGTKVKYLVDTEGAASWRVVSAGGKPHWLRIPCPEKGAHAATQAERFVPFTLPTGASAQLLINNLQRPVGWRHAPLPG